jgi:hypothetical protein
MFGYVLKRNGNWYQRSVRGDHRPDAQIRLHEATVYQTKAEASKHIYGIWKVQKVRIGWKNKKLQITEVK